MIYQHEVPTDELALAHLLGAPGWVNEALVCPNGLARWMALAFLAALARAQATYGCF